MTESQRTRHIQLSRRLAGLATVIMTLAAILILPFASQPVEQVSLMVPVFSSAQLTLNAVIAYLVLLQFYADRKYPTALVSIAFALSALLSTMSIASLPGVFSEAGSFERFSPITMWLWVIRLSGHALLILLAMAILKIRPTLLASERRISYQTTAFALLPFLLASLVYAVLETYQATLPDLMDDDGNYVFLTHSETGIFVLTCWSASVLAVILATGLRQGFDCWLAFSSYTSILYLVINFASATRFTVGWYSSRFFELIAAAALLGALLFEVLRMQQRLKRLYGSAYQASIRDGLTGLYSRRFFDTALARELSASERTYRPLSLLMLDIDHFKQYNDTCGHQTGDECLRRIAGCLMDNTCTCDVVARYGGEEFVIILANASAATAWLAAERLRTAVMALPLPMQGAGQISPQRMTISIGLACLNPDAPGETASALIGRADRALYDAKRRGRNRVSVAGPAD